MRSRNIFNVKKHTLALMLTSLVCVVAPETVFASTPSTAESACLSALLPLLPNECKTSSTTPKYTSVDGKLALVCNPVGATASVSFSVPNLCTAAGTLSSAPTSFALSASSLVVSAGSATSTYSPVTTATAPMTAAAASTATTAPVTTAAAPVTAAAASTATTAVGPTPDQQCLTALSALVPAICNASAAAPQYSNNTFTVTCPSGAAAGMPQTTVNTFSGLCDSSGNVINTPVFTNGDVAQGGKLTLTKKNVLPTTLQFGCTAAFDTPLQKNAVISCVGANGAPASTLTLPFPVTIKQIVNNGGVLQNADMIGFQNKLPANCLLSVSTLNPAGKFRISCPGTGAALGTMVDLFIPVNFSASNGAVNFIGWNNVNTPNMQLIQASDFVLPNLSSTVSCGWKSMTYMNGLLNVSNGNGYPQSLAVPVDASGKPTCQFTATGSQNACLLACN